MLNHTLTVLAIRTRLQTLSVVTTGSTNLSATATGYARTAGSFVSDGFAKGMEIVPSGFPANPVDTITEVTAATLTTLNSHAAAATAGGRTIAVGLPPLQSWENRRLTPIAGRWFVEEDYVPGPSSVVSVGPLGRIEALPTYFAKLYGLADTNITALYKAADSLLALFPPRTAFTLSTGDVVRVRGAPAPFRGQLIPLAEGRAAIVITIPLRAETANTI